MIRVVGEGSKSVWVDIRTTQQVVAAGLRAILATADGPLEITFDGPAGGQPDVVLYDVINLNDGNGADLDHLLRHTVSTVIAIDRTLKPDLGIRARDKGVEWAITLDISPDELVAVIKDAVIGPPRGRRQRGAGVGSRRLPGRGSRHRPRESNVLQLVVLGHSNQEIADTLFLSINSVKTYIRSTYRKIHVTNRGQAIVWAIQNGFLTEKYDQSSTGVEG